MRDIDRTKEFLDGLGIGYEEEIKEDATWITFEALTHKRVGGYFGFCTSFVFDKDGKFREVKVYE